MTGDHDDKCTTCNGIGSYDTIDCRARCYLCYGTGSKLRGARIESRIKGERAVDKAWDRENSPHGYRLQ